MEEFLGMQLLAMDFISDKTLNKVVQSASREIIIVLTTD